MIRNMERNIPIPDTAEEKNRLRRKLLQLRDRELTAEYRRRSSVEITERLWTLPAFCGAKEVFIYASYRGEVETLPLIARLLEPEAQPGKRVALPRVLDRCGRMAFYWITRTDDLTRGYRGIPEPAAHCAPAALPECRALFVVMPAVAADEYGNRMGYGGGYYDRYLAGIHGRKRLMSGVAALAFEEQLVAELPTEETDFRPDYIITQKRTIRRGGTDYE